jgi:Asp-tRNA(Asn)/Glu-tRNA(Gln) amidotransferase A subunit family amidase
MTENRQTLLRSIWDIHSGAIPRDAVIAAAKTRAAALEPWLKAFCYLPEKHLTQDAATGPLAGIPVGVKDIIATADMPTTNGSPVYAGVIPDADAEIVTQIKAYGGTVFGKTVSTEFAWREPGPTVNPWNKAHSPGGSSSGSAAAVAAGILPLALGSQTMGSIVRPAAFNGVVGYKASLARSPATVRTRYRARLTISGSLPARSPMRPRRLHCSSRKPLTWYARKRPGSIILKRNPRRSLA